jgi:hypothetical protein
MTNNESVAEDRTPPPAASTPQTAAAQIEIASDEDWKNRVKAEDAALDQQFRNPAADSDADKSHAETPQPKQPTGSALPEGRQPQTQREMPDPTFADLIGLLSAQAMMFLGLIPNPASQKSETQLPTARYFIDMIGILEAKTAGQLTKDESQALGNTLHELRMTYMELSKRTA